MRRIAVTNQKGGVGKTTTTANLGAALALLGRRVIVVDLDPQANLTLHLLGGRETPPRTTYSLLRGECGFGEILVPTELPLLRLAPATVDLAGLEVELASVVGRETLLRDAVASFESSRAGTPPDGPTPAQEDVADFLLLDCPPSLGVLSLNALVCAREVVLPLQTEFLALQGVSRLLEVVDLVRGRLNPVLHLSGVLACMVNPRTNLAVEVLEEIRSFFGERLYQTRIRENVRLAEAPSHGKTIFSYAPDSNGAADYLRLATEILERALGRSLPPVDLTLQPARPEPPPAEPDGPPPGTATPAAAPATEGTAGSPIPA
ncbi:MAG: ParA family protein [Planctomycetes bacterium]|nr:ParA family protein [Planctomycetota bacterium]